MLWYQNRVSEWNNYLGTKAVTWSNNESIQQFSPIITVKSAASYYARCWIIKIKFSWFAPSLKDKVTHPGVNIIHFVGTGNKGARWMRLRKFRWFPAVKCLKFWFVLCTRLIFFCHERLCSFRQKELDAGKHKTDAFTVHIPQRTVVVVPSSCTHVKYLTVLLRCLIYIEMSACLSLWLHTLTN